ncbi:MAG: trypsin-like peptidase domain-containing protein [Deltaproteobacteria bacterium]|nr:trypsin-like peptidase domain-containing protein [Deltaproteobacteria bacterium]
MRSILSVSVFVPAVLAVLFVPSLAPAGSVEDSGREILGKVQDAVVSVKITLKESMAFEGRSGQKRDQTLEVTGTCVDPAGLVVVSLRTVDRSEFMSSASFGFGEDTFKSKYETEITDVKIVLGAGQEKEIPARLVLRDKDLDLAFIRPVDKPAKPFAHVDLSKEAKPKMFDQIVVVDRMGKAENRSPFGLVARIGSIIDRPRTFYVLSDIASTLTLGSPAFTIDGKLIGIMVYRIHVTAMKERGMGRGMTPGILPAADVLEVAKQALAAEPEKEKKPDKKE